MALLTADAEQSRHHVDKLETSKEIDLRNVSLSIGARELLSGAHIRLKQGVRYALVARNGEGKSTLMKAIHETMIPGQNPSIKTVLLTQMEEEVQMNDQRTVLEKVLAGDEERRQLLKKQQDLNAALTGGNSTEIHAVVGNIRLQEARDALESARRTAKRRSGARGKEARKAELVAESKHAAALAKLQGEFSEQDQSEALSLLQECDQRLMIMNSNFAESRARAILNGLGFTEDMINGKFSHLSGGFRQRSNLAISLLTFCDVLMIDEASNFMDLESLLWLQQHLTQQEQTLVVTSHDQTFLDAVAQETIILRKQTLTYFDGTPTQHQIEERKDRKRIIRQQAALEKKKDHIQSSIQKGIAAGKKSGDDNRLKMAKSRQKKLDERFGIEQSATGGRFKLNRDLAGYHTAMRAELVLDDVEAAAHITLEDPSTLKIRGNLLHLDQVSYKRENGKTVFEDVSLTIAPGDRVALVGRSKTTLAKVITGELPPTQGQRTTLSSSTFAHYGQHAVEPFVNLTARNALQHFTAEMKQKGVDFDEQTCRKKLAAFGLAGKITTDASVARLSGGQKARLAMAVAFNPPPHLLLLDEPTTHFDLSTVQALGHALREWQGALVVITHDRWFCRYVIEGMSFVDAFAGGDDRPEDDDVSSEDSDATVTPGSVFRLHNAKLKRMERGIQQYADIVARRLARQQL